MDATTFITAESDRFATVVAAVDPATPCPTCPEWTVGQLLMHLVRVHQFWARILGDGLTIGKDVGALEAELDEDGSESDPVDPARIPQLLTDLTEATAALVAELERLDDDETRWSWWPFDQTVGFTRRMQVCEAAIHRVDAEIAAGLDPTPLLDAVAIRCLDQCLDVMWGWMPRDAEYDAATIVELLPTDAGGRWLVEVGSWVSGETRRPRAVRAPGDAIALVTVTGTLDDLARWAWNRQGQVEITGDAPGIAALGRLMAVGIG